jgi:hypothetical protein
VKIKLGDLWRTKENEGITSEILYNVAIALQQFDAKIDKLEERIASLESKPSEINLNCAVIDFDDADATEAPTGENESDMERLKGGL